MGTGWYEEGKLAKKPNTFDDFCSVAEYLIKEGYTSSDKLSIYGRSAGVSSLFCLFKRVYSLEPSST
jgi:oligopeptidase B